MAGALQKRPGSKEKKKKKRNGNGMTYFLISLTNLCDKACPYCVVARWRNNPGFPDRLTIDGLLNFFEKELHGGDVVELTGGEPTLFYGLEELLGWLRDSKAKVILRTNGSRLGEWRKDFGNLVIVLARHDSGEEYMEERRRHLLPQDLALEGIPEHIRQKEDCKPVFVNDDASPLESHPFKKAFFVTADGKARFMPCCKEDLGTIWDCKPRKYHMCEKCPYMLGAWNLANRLEGR
jgi:MoaA/NifB/PqqE/SkfB family radical SAM enzyme